MEEKIESHQTTSYDSDDSIAWEDGGDDDPHFREKNRDSTLKIKKNKRPENYSELQTQAIENHKAELVYTVAKHAKTSKWCSDEMVIGTIISILPKNLHTQLPKDLQFISDLIVWFMGTFEILGIGDRIAEEYRDGNKPDDLVLAIGKRAGSGHQLSQLFISLLRGLHMNARYVSSLSPTPARVGDLQKRLRLNDSSDLTKGTRLDVDEESYFWIEVFIQPCVETPINLIETTLIHTQIPSSSNCIDLSIEEEEDNTFKSTQQPNLNPENNMNTEYYNVFEDDNLSDNEDQQLPDPPQLPDRSPYRPTGTPDKSSKKSPLVYPSTATTGRWVHIDLIRNLLNQPNEVEKVIFLSSKKTFSYVIGIDNYGHLTDVTSRYCRNIPLSSKLRLGRSHIDWWTQHIRTFNELASRRKTKNPSSSVIGTAENDCWPAEQPVILTTESGRQGTLLSEAEADRQRLLAMNAEKEELTAHAESAADPLPTSYASFKMHPKYILKRHIGVLQAIRPSAVAVASFKGESVFVREDLSELLTITQWKKRCRDIIPNQEPVKTIKRKLNGGRMSNNVFDGESLSLSSTSPSSSLLSLFGDWQTKDIDPGEAIDGFIPTNEYGNVEVWGYNTGLLPRGTSLLPGPFAIQAAKQLGFPCAPALVDFESRGGRRVPKLDGVVVLRDHADVIAEAAQVMELDHQMKAAARRESRILQKWEGLVKAVISRQKLRETYGH